MWRSIAIVLVLCACGAPPAGLDGGRDAAGAIDAGTDAAMPLPPPPFPFTFTRRGGSPLSERDSVDTEVGCQGGSHIVFGFEADASFAPEDTVSLAFALEGGPPERFVARRASDGVVDVRVVFSDSVILLGAPTPARLVALVRTGGETYRAELPVTAVQGATCEGIDTCEWTETTLEATIARVYANLTEGCEPTATTLELEVADDPPPTTGTRFVPPACIERLGWTEGASIEVVRRSATRPCLSPIYVPQIDLAVCDAVCPR